MYINCIDFGKNGINFIMNVNEIYNLIKNAVCLQCRKDKAIYDILKQLATVRAWYRSANQDKRNINSGVASHDTEVRNT